MRDSGNTTVTRQLALAMGLLATVLLSTALFAAAPAAPVAAPAKEVPAAPATPVAAPAPAATVAAPAVPTPASPAAPAPATPAPAAAAPALVPLLPAVPAGTVAAAPAAPAVPAGTTAATDIPPGMELVPSAVPAPPPPPPPPAKFQVVTFWPGAIIQGRVTSESVSWLELDLLLRKGRFNAADEEDIPATQRPPAEGKQYAILTVKLREKRSIGKYDFVLKTGGDTIPCLAMSKDDKPYDQRLWEVVFGSGAIEVNLLYEVPAGTTDATLVPALAVTLPQAEAAVHFMTEAALAAVPAEGALPSAATGTEPSSEATPAAATTTPAAPVPAAPAPTVPAPVAATPAAPAAPAAPAGTTK